MKTEDIAYEAMGTKRRDISLVTQLLRTNVIFDEMKIFSKAGEKKIPTGAVAQKHTKREDHDDKSSSDILYSSVWKNCMVFASS